jgi:hypothetical protein
MMSPQEREEIAQFVAQLNALQADAVMLMHQARQLTLSLLDRLEKADAEIARLTAAAAPKADEKA